MAGAQSWKYVFAGWFVLLASWDNAPYGKAFFDASAGSQRSVCDRFGAFDRPCGESGSSDLGLPGTTFSLSWADLPAIFSSLDPGLFFGHAAPWLGGKVLMPTRWKSR